MNLAVLTHRPLRLLVPTLVALAIGQSAGLASSYQLEGQNAGSSTWVSQNLQGWKELDYIPCRFAFSGGPISSQTITIYFPHLTGTTPGFENLYTFTPSSNLVLLAGPTLSTPANGTWSYTMTVRVTDSNPAYVNFLARLAAGAHLNTGSSLMLSGDPSSSGELQIHKPAPGPNLPDLALVKLGSALAKPGDTITYTLSYTNKAPAGATTAVGTQISDILPPELTVDPSTISDGGQLIGNTIFWDLGDLTTGANGMVSFQAVVNANVPYSHSFTNFSQILSSENDANYADNTSTFVTTTIPCTSPSLTLTPAGSTNCPGQSVTFTAVVTGSGPLSYVWSKGGVVLPATGNSLTVPSVTGADGGTYSVLVSNVCGSATASAVLVVNQDVVVSQGPVSLTNCPGTSASFSVNATGTGLSYQWYKGSTLLTGQTGSTLSLPSVSANDAGTYSVVVSGACGSSVTNSASLTVNQSVLVSQGPVSLTNCPGTSASFSVNATGTGLSYQWYKGATLLTGQTGSTLTLASVSASDAGTYSVVVSGVCGNAVTSSATLTVNQGVVVSQGPVSLTNCPSTSASFTVNATGTGLSYQWYKGSTLLAGQTGSTLLLPSVSATDAGTYSVVVSGLCGNAVTNSASLTVNQSVLVSQGPVSLTNCPGTSASFSVNATGTGLSYQWYKGSTLLTGQTGSTLTLASVSASDAGTYSVVVSGACGNALTNSASLTVNQSVLVSQGPVSLTNCPGTSASFSVNATGTGLSYQWYKGATLLTGQTGSTLTLASVSATDAGTYSVVVSGVCGNAVTSSASLTVNQGVVVSQGPVSLTNCPSTSASFTVNATGTGLSYQWYKGSTLLAGQSGSTLLLPSVSASDAGTYSVVVSGACGNPVTNSASLTVNQSVVVSQGPVSLTNCPGTSASFSVNATGTGLSYQWYKGATLLTGQTGSTLTLASVSATDAGTYGVAVSGACGNAVTSSASLTVNQGVVVSQGPVSLTNCPSTSASFTVNATGTGLSYQWYKSSTLLGGQTGSTLLLPSVSTTDAGTYSVVVSGVCGNAVTNSASLTVNQSVLVSQGPVSLTNCPGTSASFSVNATGTGVSYQWYKGSTLLGGQTGSTLLLPSVSANDAGTYSVVVSGVCGNAITNSASLTVNQSVLVSQGPVSLTNCPGTSASFSVNAIGTGLSYQWYRGSTLLGGQTGSTLLLSSVSATDAGTYSVVVSGACGNSVTNSASLAVNQSVLVSQGPVSLTNCPGTSASFSVNATGTGLSYQWYKGSTLMAGQTGSTLLLPSVSGTDAGIYSVVVSGMCGTAITNSASLTVNQSVLVSQGPASLTNCPGTTASFTVNATGTGLSYQWYKGSTLLAGQTGSTLRLPTVSVADAGTYSVVVSGVCGNAVTNSASLTVKDSIVLAQGPVSLTNCVGTTATFSVGAGGTDLSFVWSYNDTVVGTNSTLVLTNVSAANAGIYQVVVSGACGSPVTNTASLTVNPLTGATPFGSVVRNLGESVTFATVASGTGPFTYAWTKDGVVIPGQTASSLTLTNLGYADQGVYQVEVNGACNTAVQSATLTINHPPVVNILTPTNGTVFMAPASFTVLADAFDIDGTVTNVEFFQAGLGKLGQTNVAPYSINLTNLAAGSYTFTARATDNLGAQGTSSPVTVTVLASAPLTIISALQFNPQTGLFQQTVRVTNPTPISYDAVRVSVYNLTSSMRVYNASGTNNGVPYVQTQGTVPSGGHVDFVIEYYVSSSQTPNPSLVAALVEPSSGGGVTVVGTSQRISRALMLSDKTFLLEFNSVSNRVYYIQYTSDLRTWQTAEPAITGTGADIQWIDAGLPKTVSAPANTPVRFYRLISLQ